MKKINSSALIFPILFLMQIAIMPAHAGEAKPADSAASTASSSGAWDAYPPEVQVTPWGQEIRIRVTPSSAMGKDKADKIQSVKLESEKGEFLGVKNYVANETDRTAEFMVNPALLKLDKVRVVAVSSVDGTWSSVIALEPKAEKGSPEKKASPETPSTAAAPKN